MNKVQELKEQLAKAEAEEKASQQVRELAEATAALENRVYWQNSGIRGDVHIHLKRYGKVTRDKFSGSLQVTGQSISVQLRKNRGFTITRLKDEYPQCFRTVMELLLYSRGELPLPVFNELWRKTACTGESFFDKLKTRLEAETQATIRTTDPEREDLLSDDDEAAGPPDLLFVQLEAHQANMLPHRFQLPGYRYVLTPGSVEAGMAALNREEEALRRCDHLYEACDMGYVNRKDQDIVALRAALRRQA